MGLAHTKVTLENPRRDDLQPREADALHSNFAEGPAKGLRFGD